MIVVSTPTGSIGRQVVDLLLDAGRPIRVVSRDPARLSPAVRDRAEVVQGSLGDAEVVGKAFAGADAVFFWVLPTNYQAESVEAAFVDFARPACAAFAEQGVPRVVGVAALGRGTPVEQTAGYVTASLAMDDLIAAAGVHYRALTMPSFMDNLLSSAGSIRDQGVFVGAIDGDRKLPSCATRDIAAVAARWLLDDTWTGVDSVPVLGPADRSSNDMARIAAEVLGTPVRYQQIPGEVLIARLTGFGMSPAMAGGMAEMAAAKNAGLDNAVPRTPENTTPTTFRQWCEEVLEPAVQGR